MQSQPCNALLAFIFGEGEWVVYMLNFSWLATLHAHAKLDAQATPMPAMPCISSLHVFCRGWLVYMLIFWLATLHAHAKLEANCNAIQCNASPMPCLHIFCEGEWVVSLYLYIYMLISFSWLAMHVHEPAREENWTSLQGVQCMTSWIWFWDDFWYCGFKREAFFHSSRKSFSTSLALPTLWLNFLMLATAVDRLFFTSCMPVLARPWQASKQAS